jgi:5-methylcytosine-specific restriction protein A
MPTRPLTYCLHPGCAVRVVRGVCPQHAGPANSVAQRWYDLARWARLREEVFVEQAYACAQCGRVQLRLELDHIRKHEGQPGVFWNRENLQGLCTPCHTRKTRRGE